MKIAKYIHELLLENETVIIPGFGAFISTYKPAVIDENEIKPPSKEISFTQQIRSNDGLLITTIARKAKISQPNALKRIERELENILNQLDKGEKVAVENVGVLFYNEKNEIQFTPFQDDNLLLDSFGLETISTKDTIEKPLKSQSTEDLEEVTGTLEETKEINTETLPFPEPEQETDTKKVLDLNRFKVAEPKLEPEKKKTKNWLFLLILIPIFIVGYFMLRNNSSNNRNRINMADKTNNEQQGIQIKTIEPAEPAQNDSIQKSETDSVQEVAPAVSLSSKSSKYYLVGGGFKNEENAEKYLLRLKEKGIDGINLGKRGNMYLVGIAAFDSEADAYKSLNEHLKTDPGWNLWIYKK